MTTELEELMTTGEPNKEEERRKIKNKKRKNKKKKKKIRRKKNQIMIFIDEKLVFLKTSGHTMLLWMNIFFVTDVHFHITS